MADRHKEAWSALLTVYNYKSGFEDSSASMMYVDGTVKIDGEIQVNEGVTAPEIAEVLGVSNETGRRRMEWFREKGLVTIEDDSGRGISYMPETDMRPKEIWHRLEG